MMVSAALMMIVSRPGDETENHWIHPFHQIHEAICVLNRFGLHCKPSEFWKIFSSEDSSLEDALCRTKGLFF